MTGCGETIVRRSRRHRRRRAATGQPDIAHLFADLGETSDFQRRPPPGFALRHTREHQIADPAVEMILQFAVEPALEMTASKPIRYLLHGRPPSSKINWTAPESRAQLAFSTASCFRPEAVKE